MKRPDADVIGRTSVVRESGRDATGLRPEGRVGVRLIEVDAEVDAIEVDAIALKSEAYAVRREKAALGGIADAGAALNGKGAAAAAAGRTPAATAHLFAFTTLAAAAAKDNFGRSGAVVGRDA